MSLRPPAPPRPGLRRLRSGLLLLTATGLALAGARAQPPEDGTPQPLRFAFSGNVFRNANVNDATAAYRVFLERLARQKGYSVRVETEIYRDPADYEAALTRSDQPVHLSVVVAWDFLHMNLPAIIRPRWVVAEDGEPGRAFLLLTHRDRGARSLIDLRGKTLSWLEFVNSTVTRDWLATLLREQGLPTAERFFGSILTSAKPSATVLPVFFGTSDACLVDEPSFRLMGELNPQVASHLTPIARTERIADVLVCLRETDWASEPFKQDITAALTDLHLSADGRQLLTLFRIRQLLPFEPAHLDTLRALQARHRRAQVGPGTP